MPTYRTANDAIQPYIDRIMEHHPELAEAGVTIDALFAFGKKDGPPPVKLHGYPCAAIVKKNDVKARLRGIADVTITFDADQWETLNERERLALVDHEVEHVTLVRDKDGRAKEDDAGRPVVGMALHDWQLGGFRSIARRYRGDALEVQEARAFKERHGQLVFAWDDDNAPADDIPAVQLRTANDLDDEDAA